LNRSDRRKRAAKDFCVLECRENSRSTTDQPTTEHAAAHFFDFFDKGKILNETLDFFIDVFLEFSKPKATDEEERKE